MEAVKFGDSCKKLPDFDQTPMSVDEETAKLPFPILVSMLTVPQLRRLNRGTFSRGEFFSLLRAKKPFRLAGERNY